VIKNRELTEKKRAAVYYKLLATIFGILLALLLVTTLWQPKKDATARLIEPASPAAACPTPAAWWSPGDRPDLGFKAVE